MKDHLNSLPLQRACAFIADHYSEPLGLKQICQVAGVSSPHLTHLFRKELSVTPKKYLWQYRLGRAAELLEKTGFSISQVGYRIGFQSNFHFSRLFKQHFQVSPSEFRQSLDARKQPLTYSI